MKRIGGALLAFALLLCVTPAWAEDAVWSYDVNNMYLKLTGELSGDVIVPEQADGYWSSAIQYNAFYGQHAVSSLTMPDTLRALGSGAVSGMDGLTYSLLFHEDGTVEFVMAGSAVPGLTWSRETVMTETGEAEAFAIQWFEQVLYAMLTESGFDLNYFDSMLIHFGPEA